MGLLSKVSDPSRPSASEWVYLLSKVTNNLTSSKPSRPAARWVDCWACWALPARQKIS